MKARPFLFLFVLLTLSHSIGATTPGSCSEFAEDFSPLSPNSWVAGQGDWYFQNEALHVTGLPASGLGFAETTFFPSGAFQLDVDIEALSMPSGSALGIVPFTTSDVYMAVGDRTIDGLGALLFANGQAHLFGYDVMAEGWYLSEPLAVGGQVTSIGVSYREHSVTLRINEQDTALNISGDFGLIPQVLDTLWLVAQGAEAHFVFDNICADPINVLETHRLTVSKSGSGGGRVTSSPAGIDCGADCTEDYPAGTSINLTATPNADSLFGGWTGSCSGTGGCLVAMTADRSVGATFTPKTVDQPPVVQITAPADGAVLSGTVQISATVTDDHGISWVRIYIDGAQVAQPGAAPYLYTWGTSQAADGSHSIQVRAMDTKSQVSEDSVLVTVANGVTAPLSEDAVYYFPFCQASGGSFTGFAVSNYSHSPAHLTFRAFSANGSLLHGPAEFDLGPQKQLAGLSYEIFGQAPGSSQSSWVEMTSDNSEIGSFFQFGASDQLDGAVPFSTLYRELFFTRVFQGPHSFRGLAAETWLSLANPGEQPLTLSLKLKNSGGPDKQVQRTISPMGFLHESVASLFGLANVVGGHVWAETISGGGFIGFSLIKLSGKNTVIGFSGQPRTAAVKMYSAQLASLTGFYTNLKLLNLESEDIDVTLRATDEKGVNISTPVQLTVEAGGFVEADVSELFGWMASRVAVGSLTIEADRPGLIGDVVFGDSGGITAAALPLQIQTLTRGIFSQVANVPGFFTGVALFNAGQEAAQVHLQVFDVNGVRTGEKNLTLQPSARTSKLLTDADWMPATAAQVRGYVDIQSNQPLITQQLFGAATLLSAVPPALAERTLKAKDGSSIALPPQLNSDGAISVSNSPSDSLVESGEIEVSQPLKVSISGNGYFRSSEATRIALQVPPGMVDPERLMMKVQLATGTILPIYGDYDPQSRLYSADVFGLYQGWVFQVVESTSPIDVFSMPVAGDGQSPAESSPAQTWTALDWMWLNFTNRCAGGLPDCQTYALSNVYLQSDILPILRDIGITLQAAGFREPLLYKARVASGESARSLFQIYFINKDFDSFFCFPGARNCCPEGKDCSQDGDVFQFRSDEQMQALGRVYIDTRSHLSAIQPSGLSWAYTMMHEIFHAVQYANRLRWDGLETNFGGQQANWSSISGYTESTADMVATSYDKGQGNLMTSDPILAQEVTLLDHSLDDFSSISPYRKGDVFAFLARGLAHSQGLPYLDGLFAQIGAASKNTSGSWIPFLEAYRNGVDKWLGTQGTNLENFYAEFVLERAYKHTPSLLFRRFSQNQVYSESWQDEFAPNRLNRLLFSQGSILDWPTSADAVDYSTQVFPQIPPLSALAARLSVQPRHRQDGVMPITFELQDAAFGDKGIRVYAFREDMQGAALSGEPLRLQGFAQQVEVPVDQDTGFVTLIVLNCRSAYDIYDNQLLYGKLQFTVGEKADSGKKVIYRGDANPGEQKPGFVLEVEVLNAEPRFPEGGGESPSNGSNWYSPTEKVSVVLNLDVIVPAIVDPTFKLLEVSGYRIFTTDCSANPDYVYSAEGAAPGSLSLLEMKWCPNLDPQRTGQRYLAIEMDYVTRKTYSNGSVTDSPRTLLLGTIYASDKPF